MTITFYGSWEEMMEAERQAREQADALVRPAQAGIRPGQYFINYHPDLDLFVFGQVLDISKLGYDEEEQKYVDETYGQPHMRHYRPTKCYSVACPEGEIGDIHLSTISAIIDPELFPFYRGNEWSKPGR